MKILFAVFALLAFGGDCLAQGGFGVTEDELDKVIKPSADGHPKEEKEENEKFDCVFQKPCLGAALEDWDKTLRAFGKQRGTLNFDKKPCGIADIDYSLFKKIPGQCKFYRWDFSDPKVIVCAGFWNGRCIEMEMNRRDIPFTIEELGEICSRILPGCVFDLDGKDMGKNFTARSKTPEGEYLLRNWLRGEWGYRFELIYLKMAKQARKELLKESGAGAVAVLPDESGLIRLTGKDASFYRRNNTEKNKTGEIGKWFWSILGGKAEWTVHIPRDAVYEISLNYSQEKPLTSKHPLFLFVGQHGVDCPFDLSRQTGKGKVVVCRKLLKKGEQNVSLFNNKAAPLVPIAFHSLDLVPLDEKAVLASNQSEAVKYQEEKKMAALFNQIERRTLQQKDDLKKKFIAAMEREREKYEKQGDLGIARQIRRMMDNPDTAAITEKTPEAPIILNMEFLQGGKWEKQGDPSEYYIFSTKSKVVFFEKGRKTKKAKTYRMFKKDYYIFDGDGKTYAWVKVNDRNSITVNLWKNTFMKDVKYIRKEI